MWLCSRTRDITMYFLPQEETEVSRQDILDRLNRYVAQYGLAEAVPVTGVSKV